MLGIAAVPAITQFLGFIFLPESPRWLIKRGRYQQAYEILKRLRRSDIEEEFESIKDACLQQERSQIANKGASVLKTVLLNTGLRKAFFVGCMLQIIQQISGTNTVM